MVSPSPVSCARLPKIRVFLPSASVNAVMVNVAVVPPGYSSATTWWSTTSLSHAYTQRP